MAQIMPQLEEVRNKTGAITTSIVIPVFNEESAIVQVIKDIKLAMAKVDYGYEIIVVDDCSTDKTAQIVSSMKDVVLIRHKGNRGVGAARKTGILNAKGKFIVMLDGDGTYPANMIPKLVSSLPEFDMVVGARKQENGSLKFLRKPAKWVLLKLACFITEKKIPDLNSGLRAFKKKPVFKFFGILPDGHSWVSTITLAFLSNGYSVKYVPIEYYKRKGRSSFHPVRDTFNYFNTINRTVMYFRPLKFFVPLTTFILFVGTSRFIYHAFIVHNVPESDLMLVVSGVMIGAVGVLADLVLKLHRLNFIKIGEDME
ncbi:glycosyltransferase family 2 protein [bacterium]|nr:glycosyltransferase family 2 protein [bacterium]